METHEMVQALIGAIEQSEDFPMFRSVRSFEDAGVLSGNDGLVIRLSNGQTFQVQVIES